jgi:endonuclease/exonuclease/phosphatase family metal-dependent hydrolase
MIRRIATVALLIVVSAVLLVLVWPQLVNLQAAPVIAQVVSLRGLDVAIALAAIVLLALLALRKGVRRFALTLMVPLVAFCLVSVVILASRGFGGGASAPSSTGDLTVLSWNTHGDAPGAAAIAKLAIAEHANIVSLPDTTAPTGVAVALAMRAAGRPMWVHSTHFDLVSKSKSTTVLVSAALGSYETVTSVGNTAVQPTVVLRPTNGTGPTIIAVHAVSPIPLEMRNWRADLGYLSTLCTGPNVIMAGDFNSTLDNLQPLSRRAGADFGDCRDAGDAIHGASVGSWPTSIPPLLGAQIDHVMMTSAWRTVSMHVITTEDGAGSDHRPIVATLAPTG